MPLTELCVKVQFTEDREEWQKQLQRHCEEVYTDLEETKGKKIKVAAQKSQLTWCCKLEPS